MGMIEICIKCSFYKIVYLIFESMAYRLKINQSEALVNQNSGCVVARVSHHTGLCVCERESLADSQQNPSSFYSGVLLFERPRHVRFSLFY